MGQVARFVYDSPACGHIRRTHAKICVGPVTQGLRGVFLTTAEFPQRYSKTFVCGSCLSSVDGSAMGTHTTYRVRPLILTHGRWKCAACVSCVFSYAFIACELGCQVRCTRWVCQALAFPEILIYSYDMWGAPVE